MATGFCKSVECMIRCMNVRIVAHCKLSILTDDGLDRAEGRI